MPRLSPSAFMPSAHSSPVEGSVTPSAHIPQHSAATFSHSSQRLSSACSPRDDFSPKHHNMQTLVVTANGKLGKSAAFGNLVDYTKPDIVLVQKTKLDPSIKSGKFMPPGFSTPIGGGWGAGVSS